MLITSRKKFIKSCKYIKNTLKMEYYNKNIPKIYHLYTENRTRIRLPSQETRAAVKRHAPLDKEAQMGVMRRAPHQ